jgi:serine/threonine-protein kinase
MPLADIRSMQAAAIDLVVPVCSAEGHANGLFVLGRKRSEEPYSEDDGELLMAIAESVAMRLPKIETTAVAGEGRFEECPACGDCYDSGAGRCVNEGAALKVVNAPRLLAARYRLERRLGRGGMGTVYVALDTSLDRRVAAKLVRDDLIGVPEAADRFHGEARVAASFSHPNVVTVHDFGIAGGQAFLVMELLDGRTLRDLLRAEERIASQRALAILRDVAAAVEAAHRRQLVHRDLKPENICLVTYATGESAKVLDFGISKFLTRPDGELPMTTGGALLGTPLYMAPEQLRGENPDPSWDLWALAVIAYEMLSGGHPFAAAALTGNLHAGQLVSDPRLAAMPLGCAQFFARALAVDRASRPRSPALFVSELESLHA